jgi:HAD superfamily hydrolase (TIGR01509 family)
VDLGAATAAPGARLTIKALRIKALGIKALIFDFDGLIIDTESAVFKSYQEIYQKYGYELSLELWAQGIGTTDSDYDPYADLEALLGHPLERAVLQSQQRQREAELIAAMQPLPGVQDYLQEGTRLGLKIGMASSSSCDWIGGHLAQLGLLDYFDCLIGRDDVPRSKPDPALYREVLDCLGVEPNEAVVFEDSPNGVRAAKAAGIFTVAVPNPITCRLPLDGADLRLESLSELPLEALLEMAAAG